MEPETADAQISKIVSLLKSLLSTSSLPPQFAAFTVPLVEQGVRILLSKPDHAARIAALLKLIDAKDALVAAFSD